MQFVNHTPFPALAFEGIDQHDQAFHVVVLRQTLSFATGQLAYAEQQEPLYEEDTYFGEMGTSSVRQESDLCHYKPKCDVIVNAVAYAPQGKPTLQFCVKLAVQSAATKPPLPKEPISLNPMMAPSVHEMTAWRSELAKAQSTTIAGAVLIDKTLNVTGPRAFKTARFGIGTWRLTTPSAITQLPLRNEFAFGGECRINANDQLAPTVPNTVRLTPEQRANHPSAALPISEQAIAHTAFEANPIGRGYTQQWYIKATGVEEINAPQIEALDAPLTVNDFKRCMEGEEQSANTNRLAAGLGIRPKGHPERRSLSGTIDDAFIKSSAWLPQDFNFAVWNAAWPDQQVNFLQGNETIVLTNLCAPNTPGALVDTQGNTVLRLTLPGHQAVLLKRLADGVMLFHPMSIDTVIIEPDAHKLVLVWRAALAKADEIRALELRLHTAGEAQFTQAMTQVMQASPELLEPPALLTAAAAREGTHG